MTAGMAPVLFPLPLLVELVILLVLPLFDVTYETDLDFPDEDSHVVDSDYHMAVLFTDGGSVDI